MTEQLYRVCWRHYTGATPTEDKSTVLSEIGEAYQYMAWCSEGDYQADYWLEPVDD